MPPEKPKTRKQDLDQAYMFGGRTYGPGKGVEVPEDFLTNEQLKARSEQSAARNAPQDLPIRGGARLATEEEQAEEEEATGTQPEPDEAKGAKGAKATKDKE